MKNSRYFIHSLIHFIYSLITGAKFALSWSTLPYYIVLSSGEINLKLYYVAEVVGAREFAELYLITLFRFHLYFKDNELDFSLVLPIFTWDACEKSLCNI